MRKPDKHGIHGRAWRLTPKGPWGASVDTWLLHAPGSHPFWPWHAIYVVHLRPAEGVPPPKLSRPDASHEIGVLAIDPERCPKPDPEEIERDGTKYLMPPDVVQQVTGLDDDQARQLAERLAECVAVGRLVPDSDHRSSWEAAIQATAEHHRGEHRDHAN